MNFYNFSSQRENIKDSVYYGVKIPKEKLTKREINHLYDVQSLIKIFNLFLFIVFLLVVFILIFYSEHLSYLFKTSGISSFLFFIIFSIIVFMLFDKLFYFFHIIFFEGNTRLFPKNSHIIQLFHSYFFFKSSIIILSISLSLSLILFLFGLFINKLKNSNN